VGYDFSKRRASLTAQPELSPTDVATEAESIAEKVAFQKIEVVVDAAATKRESAEAAAAGVANEVPLAAYEPANVDARLVDARLADTSAMEESMEMNTETKTKKNEPVVVDIPKEPIVVQPFIKQQTEQNDGVAAGSVADENVLVVIISNRRDGIIPTLASIIKTSSKPVDVVLIGEHEINEQVAAHFGSRINEFKSMSVKDIEVDLVAQGFQPIWTWPDWHTSMDPSWKNENTLHVGSWDNLHTHAHELNHLRFYLPHVSIFKGKGYFYFLDDDLLVHKDLSVLAKLTMDDLDASRGLVCACNIWMWNAECFHFEFQTKKDYILSMPSLYGDRGVCKTDSESHCVPPGYWDFVEKVMPEGGKDQHAWNFGFSLFALQNWRDLKLTEKYEAVMKESYRLHVFPETSLTFGLGVSYIAFAGAVECWNEDYVKVRDGFGFIEWDRYASTFGEDFYQNVSVAHYTGPDKPWEHESRIERRAIEPWLKMMELEKMPIPKQLPLDPTDNLFTLLASDRTGAQWLMSMLDGHPHVCASGEADKPETGFPADVLFPDGLPWYPYCSIKRGCSYEFVSKMIVELTSNMTDTNVPLQCLASYDAVANDDPLVGHLPRLCNFVKKLDGVVDGGNVARLWVDAFIQEDRSLLGCGCVRGVKAKGLKVMAEWILPKGFPFEETGPAYINLNHTKVHGNKIIRLKRRNLWARYKSMLMAHQTGIYHPTSPGEKKSQLDALKNITVEIEHMEWNMKHMEAIDRAGDEWATEHASEVLWVDYEDCRADTAGCFTRIYNFIGVDSSHVTGKKAGMYQSHFASFANSDSTMDYITNRGEIKGLLGINGWAHYVADEKYAPIQFLTYQESDLLVDSRQYMGINTTLFGQDRAAEGHGSKYSAVLPLLRNLDAETLVVLSSDRDGRVNFPVGDHETMFKFLYNFRQRFEVMTRDYPGAVVASTDSDCCASALTHASPGDFFDDGGQRKTRSCVSGEPGCQWAGDTKALPWQSFMKGLASQRSEASSENVYLDTSLLAAKAGDLLRLIKAVDVSNLEDDRAVFTDFMYRNPTQIILDYEQQLLGESRKPLKNTLQKSCFAGTDGATSEIRRLDLVESERQPLFMYSPRDLGCGDVEKHLAPKYPVWGESGIVLKPILDHIDRVAEMKESIVLPPYYGRKPDYRQGPEVPYILDDKGIWTSRLIRDRTNNETFYWRMMPTEGLAKLAHEILMKEDTQSVRWNRLKATVRSGGFPYWSWYVRRCEIGLCSLFTTP
jgi:lipopolysaccharide biosynthesis glycosyltransferase